MSLLSLVGLLLVACQDSLPVAPSDLTGGIVVYEHANYLGASAHVTRDIGDLKDFKGPCLRLDTSGDGSVSSELSFNDCVSSVRVTPGWRATLYRDDDFSGDHFDVSGDIPNLQLVAGRCDHDGFNDCTTSIRLFRP